jgi:IS30 family transposase
MLGKRSLSAVATLVEQQTRFVMLVALPDGRLAEHVKDALSAKIEELPAHVRRSLTWDRGKMGSISN